MALIDNAIKGARMAGSALGKYFSNPATYSTLGKQVALETALGTAVQQGIPRALGMPAPSLGSSLMHTALNSAMVHPLTGGMEAMGAPKWAANTTGAILGGAGAQLVSQAVSRPIAEPEPHEAPNPQLAEYRQLQQINADMENQRYQNQIQLAYARNFRMPTVIEHRNPSADLETMHRVLTQMPRY